MRRLVQMCAVAVGAILCGTAGAREVGSLTVTSPVFTNGGSIPSDYTCEGSSVSPPIQWTAPPSDTKSVAVIVDDPDAPNGTFEHLVMFNVPPSERSLASLSARGATKALAARNSSGTTGFAPICPPSGRHHYRFQVLALDKTLALPMGANANDISNAINGHVLARGELVGLYGKGGAR